MKMTSEFKKDMLDKLEYFSKFIPDIKLVEKYPESVVHGALNNAIDKIVLSNNRKISKGDCIRVRQMALKEIREAYGEYANILDLKIKIVSCRVLIYFNINFLSVYKSPNGRLYAIETSPEGETKATSAFFITTHCLERIKERTDFKLLKVLYGQEKTALDITAHLLKDSNIFQNKTTKEIVAINKYGYFIIENRVIKTFISHNLITKYTDFVNDMISQLP